eukprot:142433-Pyramimonas_sp.AAC.1
MPIAIATTITSSPRATTIAATTTAATAAPIPCGLLSACLAIQCCVMDAAVATTWNNTTYTMCASRTARPLVPLSNAPPPLAKPNAFSRCVRDEPRAAAAVAQLMTRMLPEWVCI